MTRIELDDGKYTVVHDSGAGLHALRYGEHWRDMTGDGLVLAMAQEIEDLRRRIVPVQQVSVPASAFASRAITHYEAALLAAFPSGSSGEVFNQWNEARRVLAAAHVQQVSVPDGFCIGAWRDALEKIAKYAPQVNCAARTELERAGLIAVHALIAFSAPQFRHARGTQTASNAAPAAPAADAGLVEALEKLARLGNGDKYGNSDGNLIAQAALAAHRANGVL